MASYNSYHSAKSRQDALTDELSDIVARVESISVGSADCQSCQSFAYGASNSNKKTSQRGSFVTRQNAHSGDLNSLNLTNEPLSLDKLLSELPEVTEFNTLLHDYMALEMEKCSEDIPFTDHPSEMGKLVAMLDNPSEMDYDNLLKFVNVDVVPDTDQSNKQKPIPKPRLRPTVMIGKEESEKNWTDLSTDQVCYEHDCC